MACVLLCSAVTPRWAAHTIAVFVIRMHPVVHCRFTFALPVVVLAILRPCPLPKQRAAAPGACHRSHRQYIAQTAVCIGSGGWTCISLSPCLRFSLGIASAAVPLPFIEQRATVPCVCRRSHWQYIAQTAVCIGSGGWTCISPPCLRFSLGIANAAAPLPALLSNGPQRRVRIIDRTGNKSRRPWPASEAAAGLASARRRACGSLWKSQKPLRPCPFLSNGPQCRVRVIDRTGNKSSRPWPASEAAAGLAPARLACGFLEIASAAAFLCSS